MAFGETVDLEFLGRQQTQLLEEIRLLRQDSRDIRKSFVGVSEHFSRQGRRLSDWREDLESMVKVELGGSIANLETRMENYLERRLDEHGQKLNVALTAIEGKLDAVLQALSSGPR